MTHTSSSTVEETSNNQRPTSNIQWSPIRGSLDVGRSMLDVGCFRFFSKSLMVIPSVARPFLFLCACLLALPVFSAETKDAAYTRILNERVTKIVAPLAITDATKSNRVHAVIVQQYRSLNDIHFVRDIKINAVKAKAAKIEPENKAAADEPVAAIKSETKPKLDKLHGEFLTKLSADLSAEQVDKVKDGLTYGVLPLTYGVYLKMYPELTDEQKMQIKTWLTEARELAMDGSTSDEKHAVFGKYKGKINNYLSKAGYNAKKAEQNLKRATQPTSDSPTK